MHFLVELVTLIIFRVTGGNSKFTTVVKCGQQNKTVDVVSFLTVLTTVDDRRCTTHRARRKQPTAIGLCVDNTCRLHGTTMDVRGQVLSTVDDDRPC